MNCDERIAELEAQIEKLKAECCEKKQWPQEGDKGFVIAGSGYVDSLCFIPCDSYSSGCLSQGNFFRTREEAERERDRRALLTKMRAAAKASGEIDFNGGLRWQVYFTHSSQTWVISGRYKIQDPVSPVFATHQAAQDFINEHKGHLHLLLE